MLADYDVVIIGSGFGGAVCAYRLAKDGFRVCILERGRRWEPKDYPRKRDDAWLWNQADPENKNGWIDLRTFADLTVVQGAGVGGGSLIYSGVTIDAEEHVFKQGWPDIGSDWYATLMPYYQKVDDVLKPEKVPFDQLPERTKLTEEAARKLGRADDFSRVGLVINFGDDFRPEQYKPEFAYTSEELQALQEKGTCVHLGNCNIGCKAGAKKTLDLNYIKMAKDAKADVFPLHLVDKIEPLNNGVGNDGYTVHFRDLDKREAGQVTARIVIVAAGSLGSTELMLRCRDEHQTLYDLSDRLGHQWSYNGDVNSLALYPTRSIKPTQGPHTTGKIDFMGAESENGNHFVIEDAGFPPVLYNYLLGGNLHPVIRTILGDDILGLLVLLSSGDPIDPEHLTEFQRQILAKLKAQGLTGVPTDSVMPWFAQGLDAGDGIVSLCTVEEHVNLLHEKITQAPPLEVVHLLCRGAEDYLGQPIAKDQSIETFCQLVGEKNPDVITRRTISIKPGGVGIFAAVRGKHQEIIEKTGGAVLSLGSSARSGASAPADEIPSPLDEGAAPPAEYVITTHPLGGCPMGTSFQDGVVDHKGEVFNYENLYIADGSILPKAIGANPSKTIAALAERIADFIIQDKQHRKQPL